MRLRAIVAACAATFMVAGCGTSTPTKTEPAAGTTHLTVVDPWVKAAAKSEMTGAFATLKNESSKAVHIVSASSDIAMMTELHEVVTGADGAMVMQPKENGFTVEPNGSLVLEPGSFHIMFMQLHQDLRPGDQVKITLTFEDTSTQEVTALVKPFTGADEKYNKKTKKKKM